MPFPPKPAEVARELFIYWKVPAVQADAAHAAAHTLVQALGHAQPGLHVRLLRRADETSDKATFMETYRLAAGDITPELQAAIEAEATRALAALGLRARHVEVFESLGAGPPGQA